MKQISRTENAKVNEIKFRALEKYNDGVADDYASDEEVA